MNKAVFLVTAYSDAEEIGERINEHFPSEADRYQILPNQWLIAYEGISRGLAELLGIRGEPHVSTGLVVPVSSYSGRAAPSLWEWLSLNMNRS